MRFKPTDIEGVLIVEIEERRDDRGYFARTWCESELEHAGLDPTVAQINTVFSAVAGTLRGLHFQRGAHVETKFVRCTRGSLVDVALDLRPGSPTFLHWWAEPLSESSGSMLWIPEGCAHGFQTLVEDTELMYTASRPYSREAATGVRWDDPAFGIEWPLEPTRMSDADRTWPDFRRER